MRVIEKITTTYREQEDRLHLAVLDGEGQALGLWLTRRLANRLIDVLVTKLSLSMAGEADGARNEIQAWAQSIARDQQVPASPVAVMEERDADLITSVDIHHQDDRFSLVFRWSTNGLAELRFDATSLRQWLGIVYQLYRRAEWTVANTWPAWIDEGERSQHRDACNAMLH